MNDSSVGAADRAVPTTIVDELSLGRALAVQAVRTELIKSRLLASGGIV
jgi:hypothetical protein